jgi:hypothetical protein
LSLREPRLRLGTSLAQPFSSLWSLGATAADADLRISASWLNTLSSLSSLPVRFTGFRQLAGYAILLHGAGQ